MPATARNNHRGYFACSVLIYPHSIVTGLDINLTRHVYVLGNSSTAGHEYY